MEIEDVIGHIAIGDSTPLSHLFKRFQDKWGPEFTFFSVSVTSVQFFELITYQNEGGKILRS